MAKSAPPYMPDVAKFALKQLYKARHEEVTQAQVSAPANAPARNLLTSAGQPIMCCRTEFLTSVPIAAKQLCCHREFCRAADVVEEKCTVLPRLLLFPQRYDGRAAVCKQLSVDR